MDAIKSFLSGALLGGGAPDSAKIRKFTNKDSVLEKHEGMLMSLNLLSHIPNTNVLRLTSTPGHRHSGPKVNLSPEKRVDIRALTRSIDQPMTGSFLLCRCISRPVKMTSVITVVDDPEGELAVGLALYNYTPATTAKHMDRVLPVGLVLAIKNPWFKTTMDGGLFLRCDNPSDVVVVDEEAMGRLFPGLVWKCDIPNKYKGQGALTNGTGSKTTKGASNGISKANKTDEAIRLKNLGNMSFGKKEFVDAIRFYNQGLELDPKNVDLLSNRAAGFLSMGCYKKALLDTRALLDINPVHMKGIHRHVKALWGLNRYKNALNFLTQKMEERKDLRKSKEIIALKKSTEEVLKQHETGELDIVAFLKNQSEPNSKPLEIAEFTGPVKVDSIPGKGRGLTATEDIKAGQLIIISKAFAIDAKGDEDKIPIQLSVNNFTKALNTPGHDEVVTKIAQKLALDPKLGREVFQLFAGPEMGTLEADDDGIEEIDMKRIDAIVTFNTFSFVHCQSGDLSSKFSSLLLTRKKTTGLWIMPSFINHSCYGANCSWSFYGDAMLIRAMKPIKIGEEILVSYTCPTNAYDDRRSVFRSHAFDCNCLLCGLDKEEEESVRKQRSEIPASLGTDKDAAELMKAISTLESLRPTHPRMNWSLAGPVVSHIADHLYEIGKFEDCRRVYEKIHFVTEGTVLGREAAKASGNILFCYLNQTPMNQSVVSKWTEQFKKDLSIAYGTPKASFMVVDEFKNLMNMLESTGMGNQDIFDA